MQKYKEKKSGFTLLELLVYLALLTVAMTLLVGIFFSINRSRGQVESQEEVNSSLRFAFEKISQEIKNGDLVVTPNEAGATSNYLEISSGSDSIKYCLSDNVLKRQLNGACNDSSESISSNKVIVSGLLFTRIENLNSVLNKKFVTIKINMSARYNSNSPDQQYFTSKISSIALDN